MNPALIIFERFEDINPIFQSAVDDTCLDTNTSNKRHLAFLQACHTFHIAG
jgi:hypothetical protein